jgi:hypothetical protein
MRGPRRTGFSLMEILLATSILLGSLIVLGQLAAVGRMHAEDADGLTTAQLICQTKLNEILAGLEPIRSVENEPLTDAPGWVYSVEIESVDRLGLTSLRVTVYEDVAELDEPTQGRVGERFALTRWIRDPDREMGEELDSESLLASPFLQDFGGEELP